MWSVILILRIKFLILNLFQYENKISNAYLLQFYSNTNKKPNKKDSIWQFEGLTHFPLFPAQTKAVGLYKIEETVIAFNYPSRLKCSKYSSVIVSLLKLQ